MVQFELHENDLLEDLDLLDFPYNEFELTLPEAPKFNNGFFAPMVMNRPVMRRYSVQFEAFPSNRDLDEQLVGSLESAFFPEANFGLGSVEPVPQTRTKRARSKVKQEPCKKRKLAPIVTDMAVNGGSKYKAKQKRTKWIKGEVLDLWQGIAAFGNNWRLIKKKSFGHRTYYQVKDKGRRILSSKGWSSGRTKATHDGASEEAKLIAERMLVSLGASIKIEENTSDVVSNVGSTSDRSVLSDSEFDFDLDISN